MAPLILSPTIESSLRLMSAESEVRRRIQERGKITFAEFIEIALYWPQGGYYSGREPVGAQGDYYTSPAVHPAFGALLAVQLFQMWREMGSPAVFTVLELGAGNGLLCRDITSYAKEMPRGFAAALRYLCLDRRSPETLEAGTTGTGRILSDGLPFKGLEGCILSNEYLDAFAVHQVNMTSNGLKEVYVGLESGDLVEVTGELSDPALARRFTDLGAVLVEGQTAEVNLSLDEWAQDVSAALEHGFVLTIDYGRLASELYSMELRPRGTLTTFHRHTQTDAPLQRIGRQDMTAQVDFTTVMQAGRRAGLETLGFSTQGRFLSNLGLPHLRRHLTGLDMPRSQIAANNTGMLDLARPGGLGDFKVLAQGKNAGTPALWGLQDTQSEDAVVLETNVPLLDVSHIDLMEGRYPNTALEFDWDPMSSGDTT